LGEQVLEALIWIPKTFTLKMTAAMFEETLEDLQHSKLLIPESSIYA
jgi:hypothetical protein